MGTIDIKSITRKNILELSPYSSARDEFQGQANILMDANENPFNTPLNRYPDPHQREVKKLIAGIVKLDEESIFLGNGSDEAIDLLIRAFCEPGISNIISIDPSYGMYEVCANINNVKFHKVLLNSDFTINAETLLQVTDSSSRIIFLCSPNNPTSNLLEYKSILKVVIDFPGLVVVDEAYIDFSSSKGMIDDIKNFNNLVVLRTFSKAWGMAGIRLGMAFANKQIISILDKIKYPYNVSSLTQDAIIQLLTHKNKHDEWIKTIISQREILRNQLSGLSFVIEIFPSDANFLLVKTNNPTAIYNYLKDNGIIVRDRSKVSLCEGCLRITIGSPKENAELINTLKNYR